MPADDDLALVAALLERAGLGEAGPTTRRSGGDLSVVHEVELADGAAVIVKVYAPEWTWK